VFRKGFRNTGRPRIATIRQIAEQLGVSVATVSRVINNYPDVAPETRERVLAAIAEQEFTPDRAARSLVTGKSHVIGVILSTGLGHPDLEHPFFQEVLVGLKNTLGDLSYDLLLFSTANPGSVFERQRYLNRTRYHRVDGVVLMGVDRHDDPQIRELVDSRIPCMAVDQDLQGGRTGHVMSDNVEGGQLAVRHLHDRGHRRIALIGGRTDTRPGVDRLLGYRRELQHLGLPYRPEYVREGDFYPESGWTAMVALLELAEPPTAVFAAADLMAAGAFQAIHERGLSAPRDVAVVGFDDIQIAPLLQPSLTTIRQDKRRLGWAAGQALVRLIEDAELEPPAITVPVELVVRDSSGARAEEPEERKPEGRRGAARTT
jgi:LacI family transcriptional regulator